MPIDHEILNDGNLVISMASGTLTGSELADHMFWLINQFGTSLNSGYQQIFDCLGATGLDIAEEDLNEFLKSCSPMDKIGVK